MASSRSSSPVRGASTRSTSDGPLGQPADEGATTGAPTDVVRADVAGDLQQPGAGRRVAPERGQRGEGPEVHLLGEVVGLGPIAEAGAQPPHLRLGPPHEGGRRHPVSLGRGPRQGRQVVHRPSLTCREPTAPVGRPPSHAMRTDPRSALGPARRRGVRARRRRRRRPPRHVPRLLGVVGGARRCSTAWCACARPRSCPT